MPLQPNTYNYFAADASSTGHAAAFNFSQCRSGTTYVLEVGKLDQDIRVRMYFESVKQVVGHKNWFYTSNKHLRGRCPANADNHFLQCQHIVPENQLAWCQINYQTSKNKFAA